MYKKKKLTYSSLLFLITCSSKYGGASYKCLTRYSNKSNNLERCNSWVSLGGELAPKLERTSAQRMTPLAVIRRTDFFCIKIREWKRKSSSCACSTFKSSFSTSKVWGGLQTLSTRVLMSLCQMLTHAASFSCWVFSRRTWRRSKISHTFQFQINSVTRFKNKCWEV